MSESNYGFLIFMGAVLVFWGIPTFRGNLSLIHLYNRWKVLPDERKPYGRLTGSALMVIGGSIIITGILQCISEQEYWYYITAAGTVIGLIMVGYALLKYNRGIF